MTKALNHSWNINMKVSTDSLLILTTVKYACYQNKSQNWNLGNHVVRKCWFTFYGNSSHSVGPGLDKVSIESLPG